MEKLSDFAFEITPENIEYIRRATGLPEATLKANLNWIVYRDALTYYQWQVVPPREFKATHPTVTPHIPL